MGQAFMQGTSYSANNLWQSTKMPPLINLKRDSRFHGNHWALQITWHLPCIPLGFLYHVTITVHTIGLYISRDTYRAYHWALHITWHLPCGMHTPHHWALYITWHLSWERIWNWQAILQNTIDISRELYCCASRSQLKHLLYFYRGRETFPLMKFSATGRYCSVQ